MRTRIQLQVTPASCSLSLTKQSWSTVQNHARFLDSSFWECWFQSRFGSSSGHSLIPSHPSQLSTHPSDSPSSPSSRPCIWFPPWVPDSFRPTSKEEIYSRSIPLRCKSLPNDHLFQNLIPFKSGEPGSRMRLSIPTVPDSFHSVCFFQCFCQSVLQPAEIRPRSRRR